jgi:hypothetical protein
LILKVWYKAKFIFQIRQLVALKGGSQPVLQVKSYRGELPEVLPKDLAAELEAFKVARHQESHRLIRICKCVQKELAKKSQQELRTTIR